MKTLIGYENIITKLKKKTSITIGNFDGVHKGHQKIIRECVKVAKKKKLYSIVLTFEPHPKEYFNKQYKPFKLTSITSKIDEIKKLNINYFITLKFNNSLNHLSPENFIKNILIKNLKARNIVVGYNFRFGYKRKGNVKLLKNLAKKYDYNLNIVKPVITKDGKICNSTLIRKNLQFGKYEKVKEMLGRSWQINGKVIKGTGRGDNIGYPTANMKLKDYIIPCKGVYVTESYFKESKNKKKYLGIANIGNRPTFGDKEIFFENHFFNIKNKTLYGKNICTNLISFLRKEKKFFNINELKKQIKIDIDLAKKILNKKK